MAIFYLIFTSTHVKSLLMTITLLFRKALTKLTLIFYPPDNCLDVIVEN